jgi:hypothetical protein
VRIDSLALQMRPRTPHEAADLGVRLCQVNARTVYRCYLLAAIPVALFSLSLFEVNPWLPGLLMWWTKPWLDRTVVFVLARAAFGQATTVRELWDAQREVWWAQLASTLTWRRLSPWRSFTQPVCQLEGLGFLSARRRIVQLRKRRTGAAAVMTGAFSFAETGLVLAILSLVFWFTPPGSGFDLQSLMEGYESPLLDLFISVSYVLAVLFLEPFYVAAGFGMYLNRRTELEAWDIEQEFRRAFAT